MNESVFSYNSYLEKSLTKIENNINDNLSIEYLASIAGYSPSHFQRIFKDYVGEGVASYIRRLRVEKAAFMLKYQYKKISTVAMRTGFNSNTSLTRAFKDYYNISPIDFKLKHKICLEKETPDFSIIKLDDFNIFFVRTFGHIVHSEPIAWQKMVNNCPKLINNNSQLMSICYDEPTLTKNHLKLRYEACVIYDEQKHKNIKNLVLKKIEGGYYAKFNFNGTLKECNSFFYDIFNTFYHDKNIQISLKPILQIIKSDLEDLLKGRVKMEVLVPLD